MRGGVKARMSQLEANWWQALCRRMDRMTDQELADHIGPGALGVMDALPLDELALVAQGNAQAIQRFRQRLEEWQG